MRTATDQQAQVLRSRNRSVFVRVKINRAGFGGSDWVDMTQLEGRNWVVSAKANTSVDSNISMATVGLQREVFKFSLSPFDDDSKLNVSGSIVDINNPIQIEAATLPQGTKTAADSDYDLIFDGIIDAVNFAGDVISLKCSDKMGLLVSAFIETIREYGADTNEADPPAGGLEMATVLQNIVDDNINTVAGVGPYTNLAPLKVYSVNGTNDSNAFPSGDYTDFKIITYLQQKQTVMAALNAVVALIGYDLRWRWHNGTSQFQLFFSEVDRNTTTTVKTFTVDDYYNFGDLSVETKDVRNVVRVLYGPAPAVKTYGADNRAHPDPDRSDSASITKYGRRFMQLGEASSSQIDTEAEAIVFADAALSDLKEPTAVVAVDLPFFFQVDLGDYYKFSATNEPRFSSDQSFAVTAFSHTFSTKGATTSVALRGKPSGGAKRWLGKESRPGIPVSKGSDEDNTPADAASVSATPTIGGFTVSWLDPLKQEPSPLNWEHSEVHVSASSSFTPSNSTLKEFARKNYAVVTDETPGVAKYIKVLHRDKKGFISSGGSATEVSTTTQTVGPHHMNPNWRFGVVLQNGNFNISTLDRTTNPPDFWSMNTGDYGASDEFYYKATTAATVGGGQSFWSRNNAASSRIIFSEKFPVSHLESYVARIRYLIDSTPGAVAGNSMQLDVYWWQYDKTTASSTAFETAITSLQLVLNDTVDVWHEKTNLPQLYGMKPPSDARFASLKLTINCGSGVQNIYIGDMTFNAAPTAATVHDVGGFGASKVFQMFRADAVPTYGVNSGAWDTSNFKFVVPHTGVYRSSFWGDCLAVTSGVTWEARIYYRSSASGTFAGIGPTAISPQSDGTNCQMSFSWPLWNFNKGNELALGLKHNESASVTKTFSTDSVLSIWEVTNGLV